MNKAVSLCAAALLASCGTATPQTPETAGERQEPPLPVVARAAAPEAAAGAPNQAVSCASQEETLFFCTMPRRKRLAVCVPEGGEPQYRFGENAPELSIEGGEWGSAPLSGGGEAQIRFSSGLTDYIVFSRIVRTNFTEGEPNYPAISDGVIILRAGDFVALRLCKGGQAEMPVHYDAARRAMGEAGALFTEETIRADTSGDE